MIKPTKNDIGRFVIYQPRPGEEEFGAITSFNDAVVFVRFNDEIQSRAVYRKDLFWSFRSLSIEE